MISKKDKTAKERKKRVKKVLEDRIKTWSELNTYFADKKLLWIMPKGYDATFIAGIKGLQDDDLIDFFSSGSTKSDSLCVICGTIIDDSSSKSLNFASNLIIPDIDAAFLKEQRDIQILGSPDFYSTRKEKEANTNLNSLMIELRARTEDDKGVLKTEKERQKSVVILGDAFYETFVEKYLKITERRYDRRVGTVLASHHGAIHYGCCYILMYYQMDRVIFSAGGHSGHRHPQETCVDLATKVIIGAEYDKDPTGKHKLQLGKTTKPGKASKDETKIDLKLFTIEETEENVYTTADNKNPDSNEDTITYFAV